MVCTVCDSTSFFVKEMHKKVRQKKDGVKCSKLQDNYLHMELLKFYDKCGEEFMCPNI